MDRLDRRNQRHMRADHAGQRRDLAGVVHADLEHAECAVRAACAQASAARPNGCCRRPPRHGSRLARQHEAQRLLGAGLADRAGHRRRSARPCAGARRSPSRRMASSTSGTTTSGPAPSNSAARSSAIDRRGRALRQRVAHEIVTVARLALDGEEEVARLAACACRSKRRSPASTAAADAARRSRRRSPRESRGACSSLRSPQWPPGPRRDPRTAGSGRRRSGPFHGLCRPRPARRLPEARCTAVRMASARSPISRAPGAPSMISARIAAGSSERGLSSVTMTASAFSTAIRPMSGRLPRSRSPPQPNDADEPALARRDAARRAHGPAHRACGRNRRCRARHRPRRPAPGGPDTPFRRAKPPSTSPACASPSTASTRPAATRAFSTWNAPRSGSRASSKRSPEGLDRSERWAKPSVRRVDEAAASRPRGRS